MPQVFSMKNNSLVDMVADDHLALHYLWAREGEFCSPRRAACCMWVEYTGKVPPVTQMRQQIKINNNNVIEIFEQNSRTILTHFPGSLKIPGDDRIPMLFRSFIILIMLLVSHGFSINIQIHFNEMWQHSVCKLKEWKNWPHFWYLTLKASGICSPVWPTVHN